MDSEIRNAVIETGRTLVRFVSKEPHRTPALEVYYLPDDLGARPQEVQRLLHDMIAIGWENGLGGQISLFGVGRVGFSRHGSDLFGEWTHSEKNRFMSEAMAVLARHGHAVVDWHRLTPGELV